MRFTKNLIGALALALVTSCTGTGSSQAPLGGDDNGGEMSGCTYTQGYWKNHAEAWPVEELTLGTRTYTKAELLSILREPVKGNGLVQLAHQLIAARLNIAAGASDTAIASVIVEADLLIAALVVPPVGEGELETRVTSELNDLLTAFNEGSSGPGHCDGDDDDDCDKDDDGDCDGDDDDDCDHDDDGDCDGDDDDCDHDDDGDCDGDDGPVCGNGHVEEGETCDDGNTTDGDGCSSTCQCDGDHGPVCGDGHLDEGEACDDANSTDGDGCSKTCEVEGPVCGDGVMEGDEGCDDGNTTDGDGCSATCVCE